jgi:hypothetical protein
VVQRVSGFKCGHEGALHNTLIVSGDS